MIKTSTEASIEPGFDLLLKNIGDEAVAIGDHLFQHAESDGHGLYWKTYDIGAGGKSELRASEGLYSGASGIGIFFLELYKYTREERYLQTATSAILWSLHRIGEKDSKNFSFLTGNLGVCYALMKLSEATDNSEYLRQAIGIASRSEEFIPDCANDEYINGTAGCVVALIHLYKASGEASLLGIIDRFTARLISSAHVSREGIYWDRSHHRISGLCGFSHGASGIGFTFLELGRFFNNPAFYWIAEQAFRYESQFYSEEHRNWADLRKSALSPELAAQQKEKFRNRELSYFTTPAYMNAWCHGAAGIGLSRLRAFELLSDDTYRKEVMLAMERGITDELSGLRTKGYGLCHAQEGNADLFIEASVKLKNWEYYEYALRTAENSIKDRRKVSGTEEENFSLFTGTAGVGYFYLRLLNPRSVPSAMMPSVGGSFHGSIPQSSLALGISLPGLKKWVMDKYYSRTFGVMKRMDMEIEIPNQSGNLLDDLEGYMMRCLRPGLMQEVYYFERKKLSLDLDQQSHTLSYVREVVQMEDAKIFLDTHRELPESTRLVLNPDVAIVFLSCNLEEAEPSISEDSEYAVILKRSAYETLENHVPLFAARILEKFRGRSTPREVFQKMAETYAGSDSEREAIKSFTDEYIKSAFLAGILLPS